MKIAVYGASGHTGRFVVSELIRRGHTPVAVGRDGAKLASAMASFPVAVETRLASVEMPETLDRALCDVDAVIHCAGPFLDTAGPLVRAALRAGIHYIDVTAEQESARTMLEQFDGPARDHGVLVVPAAGFFGGLGDLLATSAMSDWPAADDVEIGIALDAWWPTNGTRRTGERNTVPRVTLRGGRFVPLGTSEAVPRRFPEPFGIQNVLEVPLTETILIAHHLQIRDMRNVINEAPLRDLADRTTPKPVAADEQGRSSQTFVIEAIVRNGDRIRRRTARGRDIYATTAPIAVEAVERVCGGSPRRAGAYAIAQLVDPSAFLAALVDAGALDIGPCEIGTIDRRSHART